MFHGKIFNLADGKFLFIRMDSDLSDSMAVFYSIIKVKSQPKIVASELKS